MVKLINLFILLLLGVNYPAMGPIGFSPRVSSKNFIVLIKIFNSFLHKIASVSRKICALSLSPVSSAGYCLYFILLLLSLVFITVALSYFLAHCENFLGLSVPFYVSRNDIYKNIYRNLILMAPVMLFASISIYSPTFMFFFMVLFVSLVCFVNFSYFIEKYLSQYNTYLIFLLNFAYNYGILNFLGRLHIFIFYCGAKNFYIRAFCIHLMSFFYILLTRYYFYNFVLLNNSPIIGFSYYLFLFFSFICLVAVYIRFLVTLSIICINKIEILLPHLLPNILNIDPSLPTDSGLSSAPSSVPTTQKSLLHFSFHHNNHNHNYPKPRMSSWGKFGIGLGVCTLCVGSYTAYNSYLTAQAANLQLLELQRQNDLQEKAQGILSTEDYNKKWKNKN